MEILCTRPSCSQPRNFFSDLDEEAKIRTVRQKFCTNCGMPLLLADRYIPSKLLGQGGFGAAFLACDRYKPKMPKCAIKQFLPSGDLDSEELAVAQNLFQREAIVLEELGHKHRQIPNLYAFFTPIIPNTGGTANEQYFYLAQEFIDGRDLEVELEQKGKFSEAEVTEILTEILKILQFVHDNNTIHRDIKPSNIMRNKQGLLYLLDFGAVKQVAISGGNHKKSTGIYSMGYAPPEQMSGSQIYPSTDIYALAVTCIILLTGKAAEELYDSFNNCWQWHDFAANTSDRLKAILDRMLLPTPAQRFQSAADVLDKLTATQSLPSNTPVPITNIPSTPSVSFSAPIQRSKRSFSLIEVLGSAGFTGIEGALLYISLTNLLSVSGVSLGILGMVMSGIVFALSRRLIEKVDLLIFVGITAGIVALVPVLQGNLVISSILIIAAFSGAGAIAITAFFRLVYQLLSRLL